MGLTNNIEEALGELEDRKRMWYEGEESEGKKVKLDADGWFREYLKGVGKAL